MNELVEIVDIEDYAKNDKTIPKAKKYRIRIDKQRYVLDVPEMTGRELLTLAGKEPPEQYAIYQKLRGGKTEKIDLDETASFRKPGVERFMTLPLDQTEGGEPATEQPKLRYDFVLPENDIRFLDSSGVAWETVVEGQSQCVILYGYQEVPDGYNQKSVDLHLRIDRTYPDTQIAMVYFHPALSRKDGVPIKAIVEQGFDGKIWQRWSRHRTAQNPWRIGIDNIETHMMLVREWLAQELKKS